MPSLPADRVLETSTTTGTGTLTLSGAVTGYRTFAAVGNGNTTPYCIFGVDGSGVPTGEWETGIGTYTSSGTTFARTTVQASSNSNNAVNFSAGTKYVASSPTANWFQSIVPPRVSFNQDGTILSSYGVSAVTRVSTGIYDITRSVAAADANYGAVINAQLSDANAIAFDGSNDHVLTSVDNAFDIGTGALTVSAWVKMNTLSGTQTIVSKYDPNNAGTNPGWHLNVLSTGKVRIGIQSASTDYKQADSVVSFTTDTWVHIAATKSASGNTLKCYVNGVESTTSGPTSGTVGDCSNSDNLRIGVRYYSGAAYANASVRDVRIFIGTELSASEILDIKNGLSVGSPTGWYKMDEGSGTTVANSGSASSANGTLTNGPTWTTVSGTYLVPKLITTSRTTTNLRVGFYTSALVLTDPNEASVEMTV